MSRSIGGRSKHEAIDFETDRPWIVIHDEHWHSDCLTALQEAGVIDRYVETNTSRRPDDLRRVQKIVEEWLS